MAMRPEPVSDVVEAARVPGVRRIALLCANRLGDFIFALPAIDAVRAAYPVAHITLLGSAIHAELLDARPSAIDRVVVIPPAEGVNVTNGAPAETEVLHRFFVAMRDESFDIALQMHGGGRHSNPFVRRLGARVTAGLRSDDAEPLDRWTPYVYWQSEVMRALDVAALVGASPTTLEPRLAVTARDLEEAARLVPRLDEPVAILHAGASAPRRTWPPEHFAAVGDALAAAGVRVLLTGVHSERGVVAAVRAAMRAEPLDLCGRTTIGAFVGLASRARVVVSNDSGPLHTAAAAGAPTVGIYWCGHLVTGGILTRARHRPLLSWRLACPVCGANCVTASCTHEASFVADVPAEEGIAAALDLLAVEAASDAPATHGAGE
jgi:ADP-heptose:LPS heptosyltransferase